MKVPGEPVYADIVQRARTRQAQWDAIVASGANQRLCHVFRTPADYMRMAASVPDPLSWN